MGQSNNILDIPVYIFVQDSGINCIKMTNLLKAVNRTRKGKTKNNLTNRNKNNILKHPNLR